MKDLFIILITTALVSIVWFINKRQNNLISEKMVTQEVLELSTPFNGRIDTEYLSGLKQPAYDN